MRFLHKNKQKRLYDLMNFESTFWNENSFNTESTTKQTQKKANVVYFYINSSKSIIWNLSPYKKSVTILRFQTSTLVSCFTSDSGRHAMHAIHPRWFGISHVILSHRKAVKVTIWVAFRLTLKEVSQPRTWAVLGHPRQLLRRLKDFCCKKLGIFHSEFHLWSTPSLPNTFWGSVFWVGFWFQIPSVWISREQVTRVWGSGDIGVIHQTMRIHVKPSFLGVNKPIWMFP